MSAALLLDDVCLRLGTFSLRNISLALAPGEILALLGPNGTGKSVTLETIAGFHRPRTGRIVIGGRDVTLLPPERRRVALVLQNYGLFPHLTVAQNIAFGMRGADVAASLARFGIAHLGHRRPHDLSPGEKQRTALARALLREPSLFLFDEPFSALDAQSSSPLREELAAFLGDSRIPAIFVTHDAADASILADRVAIMNAGAIVQAWSVSDVFRAPASAFVADFLGIENRLRGRVVGRRNGFWNVAIGNQLLQVEARADANGRNSDVLLCIHADDVVLLSPGTTNGGMVSTNRLTTRVLRVSGVGGLCKVLLDCGFPLIACVTRRSLRDLGLGPGAAAVVEIEPDSIHLLSA